MTVTAVLLDQAGWTSLEDTLKASQENPFNYAQAH